MLLSLLSGYDSNTVSDYGILNDEDVDQLERTLRDAVSKCQVVITTGGISMGEKDIIEKVLLERLECTIHFGRLNMKPGKPTTFATTENSDGSTSFIFALPGNPVSACVCTELLVRPCLDLLHRGQGIQNIPDSIMSAKVHSEIYATLGNRLKLDTERPEYCRVKLAYVLNEKGYGEYVASPTGVQRSSRLSSMSGADGLMILPKGIREEREYAEAGEKFVVLLLRKGGPAGVHNAIKLHQSMHFKKAPFTIGIIKIIGEECKRVSEEVEVEEKVKCAMDKKHFCVVQKIDVRSKDFTPDVLLKNRYLYCMDVIMVVSTNISFQSNLDIASVIRSCLVKEGDAFAHQIRRGAASDTATAALFEFVVGHLNLNGAPSLLLSMSNEGIDGALNGANVLLKRVLITGQK